MHDILDVIRNLQTLSENNSAFNTLKEYERVFDELDIYVFKNWEEGELVSGPNISRYSVSCTFMWPEKEMPDPEGGRRLYEYGCQVIYKKENVLIPRKIKDPDDYRPGTKKGKIDAHPIWTVTVIMPKTLMRDIYVGKENKDHIQMAELMRYNPSATMNADEAAQENPNNAQETPA